MNISLIDIYNICFSRPCTCKQERELGVRFPPRNGAQFRSTVPLDLYSGGLPSLVNEFSAVALRQHMYGVMLNVPRGTSATQPNSKETSRKVFCPGPQASPASNALWHQVAL